MLEAWVSVLHETTNSFPDEFISKSAIQVSEKLIVMSFITTAYKHEALSMLPGYDSKLNLGQLDGEQLICWYFCKTC